jgi:hypothetical protein
VFIFSSIYEMGECGDVPAEAEEIRPSKFHHPHFVTLKGLWSCTI